ncbi:PREDICTED: GPALPP motifs-containing protein 1 [Papilio xuthus]|uniref:GPALPP motifs-containing protein 1 n=1 Tax=Papilio xuthus TaxID=66420 RepID=A0AAJ6Z811_PAPXU|nr:PREDICTED: GPALPP motifs-containing protein 1 [Papilio xuthus]
MLSDESSSDSETGRFKCKTKTQDEAGHHSKSRDSSLHTRDSRASGRNRRNESERYHREFDRRRDDRREAFESRERDRHRYSRYSPVRRRRSVERSRHREDSQERRRHDRDSREKSKHNRSRSRDRMRRSESKTHRSPIHIKNKKENIIEKKTDKDEANELDNISSSSEIKSKRSEVFKPDPQEVTREKIKSPIVVEVHGDSDSSVGEKPASYYNMIPAIIKEKSDESSEIDSSDDEKLRAKLLNLEKQVNKTKKRKHRKKHKKKGSRSDKEKSQESTASVEVSSTTDIQDKITTDKISSSEVPEVTSTQKSGQKETSEEGEILSDDESQSPIIDPTDLRHKLKRTTLQSGVCGPALPPHLEKRCDKSSSPGTEGPALPPHLSKKPRHLGPSIPSNMRKVLEEKSQEITHYESLDEDISIVGPLPVGAEDKWTNAHKSLEERALDMKIKKLDGHTLNKVDVKSREQWMLELPEGKTKYLGLEARTFRAKEGPDMSDRSSWTDTPEDKARKASGRVKEEDAAAALEQEVRQKQIASRDDEQEKAIKKHKKKHKRDESLLEMHQKKIKKKKKKDDKEDEKPERRPFSRDVDLQVNRFDEAQKRSIIKKAQELDSRFSRGEAKYL